MAYDKLRDMYLDCVNNYRTVGVYAEHNGLTVKQAETLIQLGRECHESYCRMMKRTSDMKRTQKQMCISALDKASAMDRAVMDMIHCKENPMTNSDLESLIKRKPDVYGKYSGLVGKLKES